MKATNQCVAVVAILVMLFGRSELRAQSVLWTAGSGAGLSWTTPANWDQLAIPSSGFHDLAIVGSTASIVSSPIGVANVTTDIRTTNPSPTVTLGSSAGTSGTLNISATGKFRTAVGPLSSGGFIVGQAGGVGVLNIASGGVLEVAGGLTAPTAAGVASTISLTGTATVTAASAFLDRTLVVDGSNVNFSVTGELILGLAGTHTWQIPATGASVLQVGGNADLGGTLKLAFPSGTPTVGSTWNLIDAATIDANEGTGSSFTNIDASAVTGLAPGQRFRVQSVAGGTHGRLAQLLLEQQPILTINRQTGAMSFDNPGAVATVGFDVYQIQSALGALKPANWSSIDPANGWFEANPTNNVLSELHPIGGATIAASTSINLGTPFAPPPIRFGLENEDVTFQFAVPGGGLTNGQVRYIGVPTNTLTLNVDPATGQAQIINGSNSTVAIDNYTITSAFGSLKFANGTWNSLQDQGTSGGNWFESNVSPNQIAELLTNGGLKLAPNAKVNIGTPFNTAGGKQDLVFQFATVSAGDFNADGVVDAADYTVWRDNLGFPSDDALHGHGDATPGVGAGDYTVWKSNFGMTSGVVGTPALLTGKLLYGPLVAGAGGLASASPAPEPSTAWLLAASLPLLVTTVRRKWRTDAVPKAHVVAPA